VSYASSPPADVVYSSPKKSKPTVGVVTDGGIVEQILANAPDRADHFFAVPKVVE